MFDYDTFVGAVPLLVRAARMTVFVSCVCLSIGFVLAVAIASARLSPNRMLRRFGAVYVFFFRGVPLIVQLMLAYYFLTFIGINVPAMVAAMVAISLCEGAYMAEILRGGFRGIHKGNLVRTDERTGG